jgi:hypothetical protein
VQIGALVAEARAGEAYAVINAADVQRRDNDDAIAALGTAAETLGAAIAGRLSERLYCRSVGRRAASPGPEGMAICKCAVRTAGGQDATICLTRFYDSRLHQLENQIKYLANQRERSHHLARPPFAQRVLALF